MNQNKLIKFSSQGKNRIIDKNGYVLIYAPSNPFSRHGFLLEHRAVAEQIMGRLLTPNEVVHHINFCKTDNSEDNLVVFPNQTTHAIFHRQIKQFGVTNPRLREIEFLKKQMRGQNE